MKIAMILPSQFPPDIRVEKEVATLATQHEIFLLCPRRGEQPARESYQGIEVHRVFSRAERWWNQLNLMARCYSGAWESAIEDFVVHVDADVLHVHDLPLLGSAIRAAKKRQIPVIADLHENYPAMLEETSKVSLRWIVSLGDLASHLLVSLRRWRAFEKSAVPQAHRVIAVVEEAKVRLVSLGVQSSDVVVVGNYATLDDLEVEEVDDVGLHDKPKLRFIYAGGFGPTRDLTTLLDAIKVLPAEVRSAIDVQLVGGRGRDLARLQQHSAALGIEDHVTLVEWLPRPQAEQLMREADVGLVPHVKSAHTDATVPHKLFQYMWRRLPVIVSDCAPLKRIVQQTGCGFVYQSGDSQSLAECLLEMCTQETRMDVLGEAGHRAVAHQYNWDEAGEVLLELYRDIT